MNLVVGGRVCVLFRFVDVNLQIRPNKNICVVPVTLPSLLKNSLTLRFYCLFSLSTVKVRIFLP